MSEYEAEVLLEQQREDVEEQDYREALDKAVKILNPDLTDTEREIVVNELASK